MEIYAEANELKKTMEWDVQSTTALDRTRSRVQRYALTALACSIYSSIQVARVSARRSGEGSTNARQGDSVAASSSYLQAMRIWNAAIDVVQRFDPKTPTKVSEKNPFDMNDLVSALPEANSVNESKSDTRARFLNRPGPEAWHLVLARELLDAQSRTSEHCLIKGNYRDAEYFILQCRTLSEALGAPIHLLRSICLQTRLQISLWHMEESQTYLQEARVLAQTVSAVFPYLSPLRDTQNEIPFTAEVLRLEGQYCERIGEPCRAKACFIEGQAQLRQYSGHLDLSVGQEGYV